MSSSSFSQFQLQRIKISRLTQSQTLSHDVKVGAPCSLRDEAHDLRVLANASRFVYLVRANFLKHAVQLKSTGEGKAQGAS